MNHVDTERAKPVGGVEAGFAHRAIAFVEQRRQLVGVAIVILADIVGTDAVGSEVLTNEIVMRFTLCIAFTGQDLRSGSFTPVEIAAQLGLCGEMRIAGPVTVGRLDRRYGAGEPLAVMGTPVHG